MATSAVLESLDPAAAAGAWTGIRLSPQTSLAEFTTTTVRQAVIGLSLEDTAALVTLTDNIFETNITDVFVDCASTPLLSGNTATVEQETGCPP